MFPPFARYTPSIAFLNGGYNFSLRGFLLESITLSHPFFWCSLIDTTPHSLKDSNESKSENNRKIRSWGVPPTLKHFRGKGVCWSSGIGLKIMISGSIFHMDLHSLNNKLVSAWLEHFWCTNSPRAYMDSQDSPQPRLGGSQHLPLIILFVISHRGYI